MPGMSQFTFFMNPGFYFVNKNTSKFIKFLSVKTKKFELGKLRSDLLNVAHLREKTLGNFSLNWSLGRFSRNFRGMSFFVYPQ